MKKVAFFFGDKEKVSIFALAKQKRGNSSVGRAQPCQGWGREFEPRFPLQKPQRNLGLFSYMYFLIPFLELNL